jgi:multisubunit Na+/H+ antiporter MnhE subunit
MAGRGEASSSRGLARNAGHWVAWWLALLALWVLLTGTLDPVELITGALAAALGALTATLVKAEEVFRFDPKPSWLGRVVRLPARIIKDNLVVLGALLRHIFRGHPMVGAFRALEFEVEGDDSRSATRRALMAAAITMTPNTFVVGIDDDRNVILCHQLVPSKPEQARRDILDWML